MNDLFTQLNSICYKNKLSKSYIDNNYVGNYILIKWLGFIDAPENVSYALHKLINELNVYVFSDNYRQYQFLYHTFPKIGRVKFDYIKKSKKKMTTRQAREFKKDEECIKFLAEGLEISEREAKYILDNGYIDKQQILMVK